MDDSVQVQISVARAIRPSLGGRAVLESRGTSAKGTQRRENPTASRIARILSAQLGHVEDVVRCQGQFNCSLAQGVDQVVDISIQRFTGDTAVVEVDRWDGPGRPTHRTFTFTVSRTASGWTAKQDEWIVTY